MEESFWHGKTPCWEVHACPPSVRKECPAPRHPALPCWTLAGTPCKVNLVAGVDDDVSICYNCNVYMRYGQGHPITMTVPSEGFVHSRLLLEIARASGWSEQRKKKEKHAHQSH